MGDSPAQNREVLFHSLYIANRLINCRAHGVDIDSKDGYHGAKKLNKIIHATLTEEELKGEIKSTLYEVLETCSPFDETKV
jgi:hypothetical protein